MKEQPPPYSTSPPPAGFNPPPPQHSGHPAPSHTVIVTTTATPISLGPDPARMTCPYCHANIVTSVESEANSKTHLFAILLCLFICWPCVCLPYCMDSCQSQKHTCPNCKTYLGTYSS